MPRSVVLIIGSLLWAAVACVAVFHAVAGQWLTNAAMLVVLVVAIIAIRVRDRRGSPVHESVASH
jgi:hypothetical protein